MCDQTPPNDSPSLWFTGLKGRPNNGRPNNGRPNPLKSCDNRTAEEERKEKREEKRSRGHKSREEASQRARKEEEEERASGFVAEQGCMRNPHSNFLFLCE